MAITLYWFRNDLRLTDNPSLAAACAAGNELLPIYVRSSDETTATSWNFPRWGVERRAFRDQALDGLDRQIAARGNRLRIFAGRPAEVIVEVARRTGAERVFCESIAAPEEIAEVAALREAGLDVCEQWQSSLLLPADLPCTIEQLPGVFTAFRHAVERAGVLPRAPLAASAQLPPAPSVALPIGLTETATQTAATPWFAFSDPAFHGSEASALAHVEHYFESAAPQSYKATRNGLSGPDYSTKFSPWLAVGALSPRTVFQALKAHEARCGANDSTYWIWFELLWRDFFRFWSLKHGVRLFRARGLSERPPAQQDAQAFARWCAGETGHGFVDAGMRDLACSGYLSNRMRQVVASYLIHDLDGDWRAGAAWFESRLIDYDVCSNHGNWLYLAGRGADPRQGRRFDPDKQAATYDREGRYRALWGVAGGPRNA